MVEPYPAVEPYQTGMLEVSGGHSLYWETVGNPSGAPAVFLHGGPGSGCRPGSRQIFNPSGYRAVLFDQRGSGRSRPLASDPDADLSTNTTQHLLADIERLRDHLGIERWVVAGGSWGVTLALVYAQRHPERVVALVLGAVTSTRRLETDWITQDMRRIFPAEWDRFAAGVPEPERDGDLSAGYARLLADPDPAIRARAAQEWCRWEDVHVSLAPGSPSRLRYEDPGFQLAFARLVTHYWSNGSFLPDDEVQQNMHRLAGIPGVMVHGRYDVSGPLDTAWDLHRAWPGSQLIVLDDTGHGGEAMTREMAAALDSFAALR
ncbi:MAG TPA: prolyl aminopeptidase [Streptosporangiaceae bacterium]